MVDGKKEKNPSLKPLPIRGPKQPNPETMKILIYHTGSIGDTLAVLPSLRILRKEHPHAELIMLCNEPVSSRALTPPIILKDTGTIDRYIYYPARGNQLRMTIGKIKLLFQLRKERIDILVHLVRDLTGRIDRDRQFFTYAGIKDLIGIQVFDHEGMHQTDILLRRLALEGYQVPAIGKANFVLPEFGQKVEHDTKIYKVAIGIGGKKAVCHWDLKKYKELGRHLIEKFSCDLTVFGGPEDKISSDQLIHHWGEGTNACGQSYAENLIELSHHDLYIGNDTGTIHMAAATGIKCIGIYASQAEPHRWHPYGKNHVVFRNDALDCAQCGLKVCPYDNKCINSITVDQVLNQIDMTNK